MLKMMSFLLCASFSVPCPVLAESSLDQECLCRHLINRLSIQ